MRIDEVRAAVEALDGVLTLAPGPGDGSPELAWGDLFFYVAPDGVVPPGQPFATVVTKPYPGEPAWGLDRPGAFRVNVAAGRDEFRRWTGRDPGEAVEPAPGTPDTVLAHPTYAGLGWLAVVSPGPRTADGVRELLRAAHGRALARWERRRR
ncbi:DUF6194 family protein [Blastococcus sp. SYSU D00820]